MAVRIRLQRKGRRKRPFYHIVVADERSPRDGRFIEKIGTYNPMTKPATIELDRDTAFDWIMKGAQPSDTARAILRFKGVMYRKHLQRGVSKGALSQEQADSMYEDWVRDKDARIAARQKASADEKAAFYAAVSGEAKPYVKAVEETEEYVSEEAPEEVAQEEAAPTAEIEAVVPATETEDAGPASEEETAPEAKEEETAPEAKDEATTEEAEESASAGTSSEDASETGSGEEPEAETAQKAPDAESAPKSEESEEEKATEEERAKVADQGSSEEE